MQTLLAIVIVLLAMGYLAWLWVPRSRRVAAHGTPEPAAGCNTCSGCSGCGQ